MLSPKYQPAAQWQSQDQTDLHTIKPEDVATVRSSMILANLELEDQDLICFGHAKSFSGAVRTAL